MRRFYKENYRLLSTNWLFFLFIDSFLKISECVGKDYKNARINFWRIQTKKRNVIATWWNLSQQLWSFNWYRDYWWNNNFLRRKCKLYERAGPIFWNRIQSRGSNLRKKLLLISMTVKLLWEIRICKWFCQRDSRTTYSISLFFLSGSPIGTYGWRL